MANFGSNDVSILINASRPALTATPGSVDFGSQAPPTTSPPKDVVITNTGDARLRITGLRITGTGRAQFAIRTQRCTGDQFLVGEGCGVSLVFGPT